MLNDNVIECIMNATAKALATSYNGDINVVPVSTIKIVNDAIWLLDYFMGKTRYNIQQNPNVSLVCRKDISGYQIKGSVLYLTAGDDFEKAVQWIHILHPERKVQ